MADPGNIQFHYQTRGFHFTRRTRLKEFLVYQIRKSRRQPGSLSYIFCTDDYLLQLNRNYLGHDSYTDIITFDLSNHPGRVEGEIYISVDRVKANAGIYKSSFVNELHRVIFHGMLHLLGFKDKTDKEKREMRQAEDRWLESYRSTWNIEV